MKVWGSERPRPDGDLRRFYELAIEGIAEAGVAIEVSTAGLRKPVGERYPAAPFLAMCLDAGCPIALNSDAHLPEHVGYEYESTVAWLAEQGVRELCVFERRDAAAGADRVIATGIGWDVHRLVPGRPLILGGVRVESELGLDGHSDADVLTHAVIDALLGAIGAGDIGEHFPDTDEQLARGGLARAAAPRRRAARRARCGRRQRRRDRSCSSGRSCSSTSRRCARNLADALELAPGPRQREGDARRGDGLRRPRRGRRRARDRDGRAARRRGLSTGR